MVEVEEIVAVEVIILGFVDSAVVDESVAVDTFKVEVPDVETKVLIDVP